jgi:hypothetical protein
LEKAPTLLLYENNTQGLNADVVRYGFVRDIHVNPRYVFFRFQEEGRIARSALNEFATRLGLSSFELNRTHWAVKEAGIPSGFKANVVPSYDIVFSFAGEDRRYVENVARYLRSKGVRVFYDKFEEADLWGRDLAEHFDMIYSASGRYCVIFISRNYVKKMWRATSEELRWGEHSKSTVSTSFLRDLMTPQSKAFAPRWLTFPSRI